MAGEKSSNKILNLDPTTIEYDGFIAVVNTAMKSVIGTEIAVVCRMKRLAVFFVLSRALPRYEISSL